MRLGTSQTLADKELAELSLFQLHVLQFNLEPITLGKSGYANSSVKRTRNLNELMQL